MYRYGQITPEQAKRLARIINHYSDMAIPGLNFRISTNTGRLVVYIQIDGEGQAREGIRINPNGADLSIYSGGSRLAAQKPE